MSARVALHMGYNMEEHVKLVRELYLKSQIEVSGNKKQLPAGKKPKFHNAVLDSEQILNKLEAQVKGQLPK
jgi:hypothetical protein